MKISEVRFKKGNGKYIFLETEEGLIDLYVFPNRTIYQQEKYTKEQLESDKWVDKLYEYKGIKIINLPKDFGFGLSLGKVIILSEGCNLETIKHEYGHHLQKKIYGEAEYIIKVALPSFTNYWLSALKIKPLTYEEYQMQPFEAEANKLGGNIYWEFGEDNPPLSCDQIEYLVNNKIKGL